MGLFRIVSTVLVPLPTLIAAVVWIVAGASSPLALGAFGVDLFLIDPVSLTFSALIAWIGAYVGVYACRMSLGDPKRVAFLVALSTTILASQGLALSGNLGVSIAFWTLTSLGLHRLLEHYHERVAARVVAWEKFLISRLGDIFLVGAAIWIFSALGTMNLSAVKEILAGATNADLSGPSTLLFLGAVTKCAQVPFHAWLPRTLEAPTAVSAVLHAGIVNAGGFLLIRWFDLVQTNSPVLILAIVIGTVSVLWGNLSMIAQSDVKRRLAWSTVSQMGFMILEIGLGFPFLALIHIVGHGLYKALSFLRSGDYRTHVFPNVELKPRQEFAAIVAWIVTSLAILVCTSIVKPDHGLIAAVFAANALAFFFLARRKTVPLVSIVVVTLATSALSLWVFPFGANVWGVVERGSIGIELYVGALSAVALLAYSALLVALPRLSSRTWYRQLYARAMYGFSLTRTIEETVDRFRPSRSIPPRKGV